jgi:hypothetical protein
MLLKIMYLDDPAVKLIVEKKGQKMRQNFVKLLKTNIEKMPVYRLSTIFMKTKELR